MDYRPPGIQGWMNDEALQWLFRQASLMSSVLEVGSWKGRSLHALLSGCPGPVFAVDHFRGNPEERESVHREAVERDIFPDFWANVGHFRNLVVMRMASDEAARFFADGSLDMVFIDGSHLRENVLADLRAWWPKCRTLLCGHDIYNSGVVEALRDFGHDWKIEPGAIWSIDAKFQKSAVHA